VGYLCESEGRRIAGLLVGNPTMVPQVPGSFNGSEYPPSYVEHGRVNLTMCLHPCELEGTERTMRVKAFVGNIPCNAKLAHSSRK
jgi:hypothetical protein